MKQIEVYIAMAFSKNQTGGNGAGVVFGYDLSRNEKMEISRQLGFSETAFVQPSKIADFKIEYFTPCEEVDVCGHATIATFSVMNELSMTTKNTYTIETKAGILSISLKDGMVFMEQNVPQYYDILKVEDLKGCISGVSSTLPIQIVSTGLKDIMVPISSREELDSMKIDFEIMKEVSRQYGVIGMHAFCLDGQMDAIVRNFAPLYDIDEESATGTANCALASYLFQYVRKQNEYHFEQGHHLNSISEIIVNIEYDKTIQKIVVGGHGYITQKRVIEI